MSFRINRVYTRSGDQGSTGLVGNARISKTAARIIAIGDLDELNAHFGVVKQRLSARTLILFDLIEYLQQELFDIGGQIATPPSGEYAGMWTVRSEHIVVLEHLCDYFGTELDELKSFILPGGSDLAAAIHLARTVARRAERSLVALSASTDAEDAVAQEVIIYVNRLSDLLFNMARWSLKQESQNAPLWQQEKDRKLPEPFSKG
jgi:cob(I)alamin adenosyltransferase